MSAVENHAASAASTEVATSRGYSWSTRLMSVLAVPVAPFYGACLAYLIYHPPRRGHHRAPADVGLTVTDLYIPLPDGRRRLHVWLAAGSQDRVVVVGHGIGLSKSASLAHARFLHDAGYTVCLFDHRNHGGSSQDRSFWGLSKRFTDDVAAVVHHLRGTAEHRSAKFAVYGFSFSSFPSVYLLKRSDCQVDAIICDSGPVADIPPLFRSFLDTKGVPVPAWLRVRPARAALEWAFASLGTAMLRSEWPPPAWGAYARTPMLFLAGDQDTVVPAAAVSSLASRYPFGEAHVLAGSGHLQALKEHGDDYVATVLDFLERALGRSAV